MNPKELLFRFEEKYPFLYDIEVNGVPVYTCFRDAVLSFLEHGNGGANTIADDTKGRIFPKRIIRSALGITRLRKKKTLIFTSSVYRRDRNRNLAAEWLLDHYEDAVIFEWPSRQETRDRAIFTDEKKECYCPIDYYLVRYKLYKKLHGKLWRTLEEKCREELKEAFRNAEKSENTYEESAIRYLLNDLPESYATTVVSQKVFGKLFRYYKNVERVADFWGSARENIAPVIFGKPEVIELQHGIITGYHPGYVYPVIAKRTCPKYFERQVLVYGESTRNMLINDSVFLPERVTVIGNPRIEMYKKEFGIGQTEKKWILFTSQPYEQDGTGQNYYQTVIGYLRALQSYMQKDEKWSRYELAVKLHPRESNGAKKLYEEALPGITVFDNASELYQLLCESVLQITVSSTSLYEAAIFGIPTVNIHWIFDAVETYGFKTKLAFSGNELCNILNDLADREEYVSYLSYLVKNTKGFM